MARRQLLASALGSARTHSARCRHHGSSRARSDRPVPAEAGQVLVIFALGLVALFAMAALVFDAGDTLVERRRLQDAGDAAALVGANNIQTDTDIGCSLTPDLSTGIAREPRSDIVTAVRAAVRVARPGFPAEGIRVYCPNGWENFAVGVDLSTATTPYFAGIVGIAGFDVRTTSQAVNGPVSSLGYSVVQLHPYISSYASSRRGCPSVDFGGTAKGEFQGSLYINSACPASAGGAIDVSGSALVDLKKKSVVRLVGEATATSYSKVLPAGSIFTGLNPLEDPFAGPLAKSPLPLASYRMDACPSASQTTFFGSSCKLTLGGTTPYYLNPGIYDGGIELRNQAVAYLYPGVYVIRGGGFAITAGNKVFSVPTGATATSDGTWTTDCLPGSCGILLYNAPKNGSIGQISIQAGATLRIRPYSAAADPYRGYMLDETLYQNMLIWQDGSAPPNDGIAPNPPNSNEQQDLQLSGGGTVTMIGSIYTPKARVVLRGSSGGGGAEDAAVLTVQFISWDLQFSGTTKFVFFYNSADFSRPPEYGLIK